MSLFFKKNKKYIKNFFFFWPAMFIITFSQIAFAAIGNPVEEGLKKTGEEATFIDANQTIDSDVALEKLIGSILGFLLSFVSVIFFLLVFYGGYLWMTAHGNEEQIKKAQKIILQSIVALAVIAFSYLITATIIQFAIQSSQSNING